MALVKNEVTKAANLSPEYSNESEEAINRIKRKYNVKIGIEKESPDYWVWTCAQVGYDIPLVNTYGLLGHLRHINSQPAAN